MVNILPQFPGKKIAVYCKIYMKIGKYLACPESKDTKVLNMYNILNLQKRHCE